MRLKEVELRSFQRQLAERSVRLKLEASFQEESGFGSEPRRCSVGRQIVPEVERLRRESVKD